MRLVCWASLSKVKKLDEFNDITVCGQINGSTDMLLDLRATIYVKHFFGLVCLNFILAFNYKVNTLKT